MVFLGFEKPLTPSMFREVLAAYAAGWVIPLSRDSYFDAIYFHSIGDLRRAIVEVAISGEAALSETAQRLSHRDALPRSVLKKAFRGNDFIRHLAEIGELRHRSFLAEHPSEHGRLKAIWFARGHLAHGKPTDLPREVSHKSMTDIFVAFGIFDNWLTSL